jgi:HK97 family phage portal protein
MSDSSKLHRIALGDFSSSVYTERPYDNPDDIKAAFKYWVHRCVSINASVAASVPYRLVALPQTPGQARALRAVPQARRISKGMRDMLEGRSDVRAPYSWRVKSSRYAVADAVELTEHPLLDLMASANPWVDGFALFESLYADMYLAGRCYAFLTKPSQSGPPTEITRMLPHHMRPNPDPVDFVSGFTYRNGQREEIFTPDEVLWVRRYDPANPWGGVGELEAWSTYVEASRHIAEFNAWLMKRHGAPDFVVSGADGMTEDDKRSFRTRWRTLFGRLLGQRETVAFMSGTARIERLTQTNRELEFSESARQVRDFVAAGFGVPKALLTTEDVNRANAREATDQHLRLTIWPLVCRMFDAWNDQVVPQFNGSLLLIPENPVKRDAAERIAERRSRLESGSSIDELREEDGLEPWDTEESRMPLVGSGLQPLERIAAEPMDPFAGLFPSDDEGQDEDEDGPDDDDPDDDLDPMDDPPEAETQQERAVRPSASKLWSRCGCGEAKSSNIAWSDLWMGSEMPSDLEQVVKRLDSNASAEVRMLARALRPALASLRSMLDELAVRPGWELDDTVWSLDALQQAQQMAREALTAPLSEVYTMSGQAALNATGLSIGSSSLGIGLAFAVSDDRVSQALGEAAERIASTAVGRFSSELVSRMRRAAETGLNPVAEARRLAAESNIERWIVNRVARTEAQLAVSEAQSLAWAQSPVVRGKRFVASPDACPLCKAAESAVKGKVFEPMDIMFENGMRLSAGERKDGTPQFVTLDYIASGLKGPPLHPNCACSLESVLIGED